MVKLGYAECRKGGIKLSNIKNRILWWCGVIVWTLLIYLTLPLAPKIIKWMSDGINNITGGTEGYYTIGHITAFIIAVIAILIFKKIIKRHLSISQWILFSLIAISYGYFLKTMEIPTEKIHFIEYGFLSYMIFKGFQTEKSDLTIFINSFCVGYLIGLLDEYIQFHTAGRSGEFIDILWNGLSVGLVQILLCGVWHDEKINYSLSRKTFKISAIFIIICLWSSAVFIKITTDFGIKIYDNEIGEFNTRVKSIELLSEIDNKNSIEYSNKLNAESEDNYDTFLKQYNEKEYPFLNEMRVHIFRRDRYAAYYFHYMLREKARAGAPMKKLIDEFMDDAFANKILRGNWIPYYMSDWRKEKNLPWVWSKEMQNVYLKEQQKKIEQEKNTIAQKENFLNSIIRLSDKLLRKSDEKDKSKGIEKLQKDYLFVAFKENQILEKYFGKTLEKTKFKWDPSETARWFNSIPQNILSEKYESKVAERIITAFSETTMWIFVSIISIILLIICFSQRKNLLNK